MKWTLSNRTYIYKYGLHIVFFAMFVERSLTVHGWDLAAVDSRLSPYLLRFMWLMDGDGLGRGALHRAAFVVQGWRVIQEPDDVQKLQQRIRWAVATQPFVTFHWNPGWFHGWVVIRKALYKWGGCNPLYPLNHNWCVWMNRNQVDVIHSFKYILELCICISI